MFTQLHQLTTHSLLYKTTCTHLTLRHLSTHTRTLLFSLLHFTLLHTSYFTFYFTHLHFTNTPHSTSHSTSLFFTNTSLIFTLQNGIHSSLFILAWEFLGHSCNDGKINSLPSFQENFVYGSLQAVVSCRNFQRDREISKKGSRNFQRERESSRKKLLERHKEISRNLQIEREFSRKLQRRFQRERRCLIFKTPRQHWLSLNAVQVDIPSCFLKLSCVEYFSEYFCNLVLCKGCICILGISFMISLRPSKLQCRLSSSSSITSSRLG